MVKHSKKPARKGNINRKVQSRKRGKKSGKMSRKSRLLNSINKRKKRKTKIYRGNNLIKGGGFEENIAQYKDDFEFIQKTKITTDDLDKIINRINYIKTFLFHLINEEEEENDSFKFIRADVRKALGKFIVQQYTVTDGKGNVKKETLNAIQKKLGKITTGFRIKDDTDGNVGNIQTLMAGGMRNVFGRKGNPSSRIQITVDKAKLEQFYKQPAVHGDKNYLIQVRKFLEYIQQYIDCVKNINFNSKHQKRIKRGNPFRLPRIVPRTNIDPVEVNLGYEAEGELGIVRLDDEPDHEFVEREKKQKTQDTENELLQETKKRALKILQELAPEIEFISYIFKKRLESVEGECTYPPDLYKFIKEAGVSVDIDTNKFDDVINLLEKISQLNIGLVPTIRYKSIEHYNSVQEAKKKAGQSLPSPPRELIQRRQARLAREPGKYPNPPTTGSPPAGQAPPSSKLVTTNTGIQIYLAKRDADIAEMERLSAPAEAQPIYATPWAHLAAGTPDAPTAVPAADPAHVDLELENKVNAWHDQVAKEVEKPDGKGPIFEAPGRNVITAHQIPEDDKLPPGWEIRYDRRDDQNNKPYYVNHNTRTTQWDRPVVVAEPERPQLQFEPSSHEPHFSEAQVLDMLAEQLTAMGVVPEEQTWQENLDILFGLYRDTFEQARSLGEHLGIMVDLFLRRRESNSNPTLTTPTLDDIAASVSAPSPKRRPVPAPRPRHTFNKHKSAPETITPADVEDGGERIVSIVLPGN
jgi:hypothetical protein